MMARDGDNELGCSGAIVLMVMVAGLLLCCCCALGAGIRVLRWIGGF